MSGAKLASILLFAAPLVAQRGDSSQDPARPRLPALALPTPDGARVELDRRNGRRLVLAYVRRGQALSRRVLADLRAELGELQQRQVDVLAVASGPADAWRKTQESLPFPLALDPEERLLEWLAPKALPVTLVVDARCGIVARIFLHRRSFRRVLRRSLRRPDDGAAGRRAAGRLDAVRSLAGLARQGADLDDAVPGLRRDRAGDFEVRLGIARILVEAGRPADALEDLGVCLELRPGSLRAKLWSGLALSRAGRKGWSPLLEEHAEALPGGWRAHGELALRAAQQGDPEAAIAHFESSVSGGTRMIWTTGGAWIGTRFPLLRLLDRQGRPARRVVRRSRPVPELFLFWKSGQAASSRCLKKLQSLHFRLGKQLSVVAINVDSPLPDAGDRRRAAATFQRVAGSFESWLDADLESLDRCDLHTIPGTILVDARGVVAGRVLGDDPEALERGAAALLAGSRKNASSGAERRAWRYFEMARQLARQGRLRAAEDSAREAVRGGIRSPAAACLLARLLCASGRPDEAIEVLKAARAAESSMPDVLASCGHSMLQKPAPDEAARLFRRALEQSPAHAGARRGLGEALLASGKHEEGLRELRTAAALDPHGEASWVALARGLAAERKLDAAVDAYARALGVRRARASILREHGTGAAW